MSSFMILDKINRMTCDTINQNKNTLPNEIYELSIKLHNDELFSQLYNSEKKKIIEAILYYEQIINPVDVETKTMLNILNKSIIFDKNIHSELLNNDYFLMLYLIQHQ